MSDTETLNNVVQRLRVNVEMNAPMSPGQLLSILNEVSKRRGIDRRTVEVDIDLREIPVSAII
jgi:hypothetical protein